MWPNGKALDYESRDSRFDPWHGQTDIQFSLKFLLSCETGAHEHAASGIGNLANASGLDSMFLYCLAAARSGFSLNVLPY